MDLLVILAPAFTLFWAGVFLCSKQSPILNQMMAFACFLNMVGPILHACAVWWYR
jgi:hypothetical protein